MACHYGVGGGMGETEFPMEGPHWPALNRGCARGATHRPWGAPRRRRLLGQGCRGWGSLQQAAPHHIVQCSEGKLGSSKHRGRERLGKESNRWPGAPLHVE